MAVFKERFDEELSRSRFNELFDLVKKVAGYEHSEEDLTVRHAHLLTGFLSERDKYEKFMGHRQKINARSE